MQAFSVKRKVNSMPWRKFTGIDHVLVLQAWKAGAPNAPTSSKSQTMQGFKVSCSFQCLIMGPSVGEPQNLNP